MVQWEWHWAGKCRTCMTIQLSQRIIEMCGSKWIMWTKSVFSRLSQGLDDDILESFIRRWADTVATYCLGRQARSSQILLKSITKHRDRREKTLCSDARLHPFKDINAHVLWMHPLPLMRRRWASTFDDIYRVTIQVVSNLLLTSEQKLCFNMRTFY